MTGSLAQIIVSFFFKFFFTKVKKIRKEVRTKKSPLGETHLNFNSFGLVKTHFSYITLVLSFTIVIYNFLYKNFKSWFQSVKLKVFAKLVRKVIFELVSALGANSQN